MERAEIKQIVDFLSDVYEGIYEQNFTQYIVTGTQ